MPPILANPHVWVLTQARLVLWMMVMVRLTGLLALLPGFGSGRIPVPVKATFVVFLAFVITPVIGAPEHLPQGMWDLTGILVTEFAVGLFLGLAVSWIVDAVGFAGHLMDFQMGFSFVQIIDPVSAQPVSVSGVVLGQAVLLFVFVSGLHHNMILSLVESYRISPIGHGLAGDPLQLVILMGQLMIKGFQLAFPVLFALFMVDVLEGIGAKFMPQLHLIQLAFPIKITVGLTILGYVMKEFGGWLEPLMEAAPREALRLLR